MFRGFLVVCILLTMVLPASAELLITEVFYDHTSTDDGYEWVEILNTSDSPVDLTGYILAYGGLTYGNASVLLNGVAPACGTFVIGGPLVDAENGNPVYDQVHQFSPGIQNPSDDADGVALFLPDADVLVDCPVDAVIYGPANNNGLLDADCIAGPPDVADGWWAESIERTSHAGDWIIQTNPDPNHLSFYCAGVPSTSLLITEVFYDHTATDDGYEWVEILNTSSESIILNGYILAYGGTTYANGTVELNGIVPACETFVIGGPEVDAENGDPVYDQVHFFSPQIQNPGDDADGIALFLPGADVTSACPVDAVIYGPANNNGLLDADCVAGSPDVGEALSGDSIERATFAGDWATQADPDPNHLSFYCMGTPSDSLIITEVFYDHSGSDSGYEWVELFNISASPIFLDGYILAYGGTTYANATVELSGVVNPCETFVIGGPNVDGENGNPVYDMEHLFDPQIQNPGDDADGVALFFPGANVLTDCPVDAVIYGPANNNGLLDADCVAGPPDVAEGWSGQSIERTSLAGDWTIMSWPDPNHLYFPCGGGPYVPMLPEPVFISISDVGNDNGRHLRLVWQRSRFDAPGDTVVVSGYAVYRRQDAYKSNSLETKRDEAGKLIGWDALAMIPARYDSLYQYVAETLCDSTAEAGICWSTFMVSTVTEDPGQYYDSPPDSGYSIDNLVPGVPAVLLVNYASAGNSLTWNANTEPDIWHYRVYRGDRVSDTCENMPDEPIADVAETQWTDPLVGGGDAWDRCYWVTAVDFAGNESEPTTWGSTVTTDVSGRDSPQQFALRGATPNPFNPSTTLTFDLPRAARVRLEIYDVAGRNIRGLIDGAAMQAGRHEIAWDGCDNRGRSAPAGIYFATIKVNQWRQTRSLALIK